MNWVSNLDDLYDFLSVVIACAPDEFFEEDYLSEDEQLNLDRAFEQLYVGMKFVSDKIKDERKVAELKVLLDRSLQSFRSGDDKTGAHLLQEFETAIFGPSKPGFTEIIIRRST